MATKPKLVKIVNPWTVTTRTWASVRGDAVNAVKDLAAGGDGDRRLATEWAGERDEVRAGDEGRRIEASAVRGLAVRRDIAADDAKLFIGARWAELSILAELDAATHVEFRGGVGRADADASGVVDDEAGCDDDREDHVDRHAAAGAGALPSKGWTSPVQRVLRRAS